MSIPPVVAGALVFALGAMGTTAIVAREQVASFLADHGVIGPRFDVEGCDHTEARCRVARWEAVDRSLKSGDHDRTVRLLKPIAEAGEPRAAFLTGWAHEEAYRAVVGGRIKALSTIPEETSANIDTMPRGEAFSKLVSAIETSPASEADRRRRLAWVWYVRASLEGFAPAMNNIGSMHQFGLLGPRDRRGETEWYRRAMNSGNPIATLNGLRSFVRDVRDDAATCESIAFWTGTLRGWRFEARAEDLDETIAARTRLRGRAPPEDVRRWIHEVMFDKSARAEAGRRLIQVIRPASSMADARAFERDAPAAWVFEADPDERPGVLPAMNRMKPPGNLDDQIDRCRRATWASARSGRDDHNRLEQARWAQQRHDADAAAARQRAEMQQRALAASGQRWAVPR